MALQNAKRDDNLVTTLLGVNAAAEPRRVTMDASDRVEVANTPVAWSKANSGAYEASRVAKASAGTLGAVYGYNSGPAQWIHIYDLAAVPANGVTTAVYSMSVPALSNFFADFGSRGMAMATGIVVCNSTTDPAKTLGAADLKLTILYT